MTKTVTFYMILCKKLQTSNNKSQNSGILVFLIIYWLQNKWKSFKIFCRNLIILVLTIDISNQPIKAKKRMFPLLFKTNKIS